MHKPSVFLEPLESLVEAACITRSAQQVIGLLNARGKINEQAIMRALDPAAFTKEDLQTIVFDATPSGRRAFLQNERLRPEDISAIVEATVHPWESSSAITDWIGQMWDLLPRGHEALAKILRDIAYAEDRFAHSGREFRTSVAEAWVSVDPSISADDIDRLARGYGHQRQIVKNLLLQPNIAAETQRRLLERWHNAPMRIKDSVVKLTDLVEHAEKANRYEEVDRILRRIPDLGKRVVLQSIDPSRFSKEDLQRLALDQPEDLCRALLLNPRFQSDHVKTVIPATINPHQYQQSLTDWIEQLGFLRPDLRKNVAECLRDIALGRSDHSNVGSVKFDVAVALLTWDDDLSSEDLAALVRSFRHYDAILTNVVVHPHATNEVYDLILNVVSEYGGGNRDLMIACMLQSPARKYAPIRAAAMKSADLQLLADLAGDATASEAIDILDALGEHNLDEGEMTRWGTQIVQTLPAEALSIEILNKMLQHPIREIRFAAMTRLPDVSTGVMAPGLTNRDQSPRVEPKFGNRA